MQVSPLYAPFTKTEQELIEQLLSRYPEAGLIVARASKITDEESAAYFCANEAFHGFGRFQGLSLKKEICDSFSDPYDQSLLIKAVIAQLPHCRGDCGCA